MLSGTEYNGPAKKISTSGLAESNCRGKYHSRRKRVKDFFVTNSYLGERVSHPDNRGRDCKGLLALLADETGDRVHQIEFREHFQFAGLHLDENGRALVAQQVRDTLDGRV